MTLVNYSRILYYLMNRFISRTSFHLSYQILVYPGIVLPSGQVQNYRTKVFFLGNISDRVFFLTFSPRHAWSYFLKLNNSFYTFISCGTPFLYFRPSIVCTDVLHLRYSFPRKRKLNDLSVLVWPRQTNKV